MFSLFIAYVLGVIQLQSELCIIMLEVLLLMLSPDLKLYWLKLKIKTETLVELHLAHLVQKQKLLIKIQLHCKILTPAGGQAESGLEGGSAGRQH